MSEDIQCVGANRCNATRIDGARVREFMARHFEDNRAQHAQHAERCVCFCVLFARASDLYQTCGWTIPVHPLSWNGICASAKTRFYRTYFLIKHPSKLSLELVFFFVSLEHAILSKEHEEKSKEHVILLRVWFQQCHKTHQLHNGWENNVKWTLLDLLARERWTRLKMYYEFEYDI